MAKEHAARGWGPTVAGFVLLLLGFGVVFWAIWTTNSLAIQLNTTTIGGATIAAAGIGLLAIGIDHGAPKG